MENGEGVSPPQLTRLSGGASYTLQMGFRVEPRPKMIFIKAEIAFSHKCFNEFRAIDLAATLYRK